MISIRGDFYKRPLFLLIIGLILTIGGILFIFQSSLFPFHKLFNGPKPISKPTSVRLQTINGTIASVKDTNLVVKDSKQNYNLFIKGVDIQRIASGTIAAGNAKTVPAQVTDLKVGQQVYIIAEKSSLRVHSIYIIK